MPPGQLALNTNINKPVNYLGRSKLHIATTSQDITGVQKLIQTGADVNKKDLNQATPLIYACSNGNVEIVKALLDAGADPNSANNTLYTPLMIACSKGYLEIVNMLLRSGADVNMTNNTGQTSLIIASSQNRVEIVKALIAAGANLNTTTVTGETALLHSSYMGYLEIVKALIAAGADIHKKTSTGHTAFTVAIANNHVGILQALIEAGADIENRTDDGVTSLMLASMYGPLTIVKALIDAGANINAKENAEGRFPLFYACAGNQHEIVKTLIEAGADLNNTTNYGATSLLYVCFAGLYEIAGTLIAAGADVNKTNSNGITPLMAAVSKGGLDIVRFLLESGASTTLTSNTGQTAQDYATTSEMRDVLRGEKPSLWRGFTKHDAEKLQLLFEEVVHPSQLYEQKHNGKPVVESLYSHCPICLKYISHDEATCMYMSHSCTELGGLYHRGLWNRYKHQKENIVGQMVGKEVVSWCTLCGRICKGHQHYELNSYKTTNPILLPSGAPYDSDCRKTNGGGGWPEKLARHRRLLEYANELNKEVGKITEQNALNQLVEEVWNAPMLHEVLHEEKLEMLAAQKRFNIPANVFPNIPDAGNIQSGAVSVQMRNNEFQIGDKLFTRRNNILYKNNAPAAPVYQEFYKRYHTWSRECKKEIPYSDNPDLMPIVYTSPPEEFEDPTYSDDNQNVIQLRHRMANGAINNHTNPKGDMIGKDMFLNLLQSKMQSGERLGFCWLPTCSAKLYPQEVLSILQQSKYEDESEKAEDMKVYARYNELFAMKFCVAQLGGRKTRRKSRASRKTRR